jgi:hypothetical protein
MLFHFFSLKYFFFYIEKKKGLFGKLKMKNSYFIIKNKYDDGKSNRCICQKYTNFSIAKSFVEELNKDFDEDIPFYKKYYIKKNINTDKEFSEIKFDDKFKKTTPFNARSNVVFIDNYILELDESEMFDDKYYNLKVSQIIDNKNISINLKLKIYIISKTGLTFKINAGYKFLSCDIPQTKEYSSINEIINIDDNENDDEEINF